VWGIIDWLTVRYYKYSFLYKYVLVHTHTWITTAYTVRLFPANQPNSKLKSQFKLKIGGKTLAFFPQAGLRAEPSKQVIEMHGIVMVIPIRPTLHMRGWVVGVRPIAFAVQKLLHAFLFHGQNSGFLFGLISAFV